MTDKDTSRARKRTYNKISDVQRSKLQEYYDGGMKTCGSDNTEKIGKSCSDIVIIKPIELIFSGNESFNFFLLDECKKLSLAQKNEEAAKKWRDMTSAEKDAFKGKAESLKAPDVSELNEAQKSKLISVHRKNLLNEVKVTAS